MFSLYLSFGLTKPVLSDATTIFVLPGFITYPILLFGILLYIRATMILGDTLASEYTY